MLFPVEPLRGGRFCGRFYLRESVDARKDDRMVPRGASVWLHYSVNELLLGTECGNLLGVFCRLFP